MKAPTKTPDWAGLATESRNRRSREIDRMPIAKVVALLLDEDRRAIAAAAREGRSITRAAVEAARALGEGRRIFFMGAGTSGRLGILEAAECPPTFGSDPDQIRGIMAGGEGAVFKAVEGAEDREEDGRRDAAAAASGDLVIGISASSVTPYVRAGLEAARDKGARTVLITCSPRRGLRGVAHVVVAIATGPEVLTGSTRLKAGSATKAALNAITTAAMVGLGKAYENLMVDLKPTNAKLKDRARRIVVTAGKVGPEEADRLLADAGGHVKTAIVMARTGDTADAARERIVRAGGHVRVAVKVRTPRRKAAGSRARRRPAKR